MLHHLPLMHGHHVWSSCYMIHVLPSKHGHVMRYITWSYHMIRHLLSMHRHVILYIIYYQSTVILNDTLPINDARTCFITYARTCCMIHHLLSMEGDISYEMTNYSWWKIRLINRPVFLFIRSVFTTEKEENRRIWRWKWWSDMWYS
jgi:hypothetical protein